jgi:hypothetical protein
MLNSAWLGHLGAETQGSCNIRVATGCVRGSNCEASGAAGLFEGPPCSLAAPLRPWPPLPLILYPQDAGVRGDSYGMVGLVRTTHANEGTTTFIGVGCAHAQCALCMLAKTQTNAPPPRVAPLPH